jgi:WD40 repeat protein
LLETETGQILADFEAPRLELVQSLCFNNDGTELLASDNRGQVHVWNLRALRKRLKELNLDWDMPPYPPAEDTPSKPVRIEVVANEALGTTERPTDFAVRR